MLNTSGLCSLREAVRRALDRKRLQAIGNGTVPIRVPRLIKCALKSVS